MQYPKRFLPFLLIIPSLLVAEPTERVPLLDGWRFAKGDPAGTTAQLDYSTLRPWLLPTGADFVYFSPSIPKRPEGNPPGEVPAAQPGFDDKAWRSVEIPHDWGIEGPFSQTLPGETGKLPWWGVAWYRRSVDLPASDAGKRFYLDLDGAMSHATVWVNGHLAGGWPYGYSSFRVDLSNFVRCGEKNTIAIRIDNPPESSRWYPGAGLYRKVWFVKSPSQHIAQWGVYVTTPVIEEEQALVDLRVQVENHEKEPAPLSVRATLHALDHDGKAGESLALSSVAELKVSPGKAGVCSVVAKLPKPALWSPQSPNLYEARVQLLRGGKCVDEYAVHFGVRSVQWDDTRGFVLNGQPLKIQGVCNHHDLGALGAAVNTRALERQLELLREMGCNAIRTSHNPPAPELLALCDRLGFVVMDEAFDCWLRGKTKNDYGKDFADWHEQDLRALVRRDRNHPSVVLWSIGNEIREQGEPGGWKLATHLTGIVRQEDPTRAVGGGFNVLASAYNGFQKTIDVFGFNYKPFEYGKFHDANPGKAILGSETSSCVSSRGEYFFPVSENKDDGRANFQVSSYDLYAPGWAFPPDREFEGLDKFPNVAGEFVWTGFDYLGEPTPYNADTTNLLNFSNPADQQRVAKELAELGKIRVPSRSSYFGILDLAGFKKDRFFIYQARWRPELPMAHILPHWTWPGREGQITPVHVYSSGDEAELFLNGKSLGRKKRQALQYRFRWDDVRYEPGQLQVKTYKQGKPWAEASVATAGACARMQVSADRARIRADGEDLSFVTVSMVDAEGRFVPQAAKQLVFEASGAARVVAVDNGDATSLEPFQSNTCKTYNGLALAILRSKRGEAGKILLKVRCEGLPEAVFELESQP